MPIKGLSDQRRFTRGGHLRLGIKKQSARGSLYPEKSDHFIADFESPEVEALFYKLYGDKPTRIEIAFAGETQEEIFPQFYKCYGASSGLKCKGDGEVAYRADDKGELHEVECPAPDNCDYAQEHGCKQIASLQFFIKGLPGIQVFQVNTTSYWSITNLNTGIDLLQSVRGGRRISGVWVSLLLVPQLAQVKGKQVTIYVMKLDINASLDNLGTLECAFEQPRVLPEPDESRDEYLTPTLPAPEPEEPAAAHPGVSPLVQEFLDTCENYGLDVSAECYALLDNHKPTKNLSRLMDTQVQAGIDALHARAAQAKQEITA